MCDDIPQSQLRRLGSATMLVSRDRKGVGWLLNFSFTKRMSFCNSTLEDGANRID